MSSSVRLTKTSFCWQSPTLQSAHGHRFRPAVFSLLVKRSLLPEKTALFSCLSGFFQKRGLPSGVRSDNGGSHRIGTRLVQLEQTCSRVASPGYRHRSTGKHPTVVEMRTSDNLLRSVPLSSRCYPQLPYAQISPGLPRHYRGRTSLFDPWSRSAAVSQYEAVDRAPRRGKRGCFLRESPLPDYSASRARDASV